MTAHLLRRLLIMVAAVLAASVLASAAWTQAGTINIVMPYTPVSVTDIYSHHMTDELCCTQGPTVVIENRPGGGTVIGTEAVERAAPDGHTVLLVANSFVINPPLQRANYDPTGSFDFFFQAEDGIRDHCVTGVQTCALPI